MFVWDAPAHGLSRPFELSFSMQDIVHYLYTIFQIEHIVMPIFVGQSLGGYIAQVYITECAYRLHAAERKIDVKDRNMGY